MRIITKLSFISAFMLASIGAAAQEAENTPPSVGPIPPQTIDEGKKFAPIKLDKYVTDDFDRPEKLKWSVSGNKQLKVSISPERIATIEIPNQYWNGSEDITFIATDSKGATGSETVNFNVESVNNPPEVKQIPDQTIDEGKTFAKIKLDDYVTDPDHPKNQILWEFDISPIGSDQADGDLNVEIDPNRVASVIIPDPNWYGAANIKFTATDGEYASDFKTATFTVKPINDAPVLKKIPDQTIEEKKEFETICLTDYVSDVDDDVAKLTWSISGNKNMKFDINEYGIANIKIPNEFWNGSETVTFTVTDPEGAYAKTTAVFMVKSVNDVPVFVQEVQDQTIDEKQEFKPIDLTSLVKDPDHSFEQLKWSVTGNKVLVVNFAGKTASIRIPNKLWNGSESIKFKVCDPAGACAESENIFTVNSVNDVPQLVKQIPNQTIDEKKQFAKIKLDEYVKDADHKNNELLWEVDVKHQGSLPQSGTLNVSIDDNRVASIEIPDIYWNGSAVATFTVSDPEGATAKQQVTFTVKSINDVPIFKKIPDQTIETMDEFKPVMLEDYLSDADQDFSLLKIEISGNKDIKVNLNNKTHEVTFGTPSEFWNGSETITFKAIDPEGASATCNVVLTVEVPLEVLSITDDQNDKIATFNALNNASVIISEPINVKKVIIIRNFTADRPSTMILPFGCDASKFSNIGTFHTVASVEYNQTTKEWEAKASDALTSIEANTPYLFLPTLSTSANNPIVIEAEKDSHITIVANNSTEPYTNVDTKENSTLSSDWKLIGVYQKKRWTEDSQDEYGFSAVDVAEDGISAGEFVRAGSGAWTKPMRCYLKYTGNESQFLSKSATKLPQSIRVIFPETTASVIDTNEPSENPAESGEIITPISGIYTENVVNVWSFNKTIYIKSQPDTHYQIMDLGGRIIKKGVTNSTYEEISLSRITGVVIVKVGIKIFKISM